MEFRIACTRTRNVALAPGFRGGSNMNCNRLAPIPRCTRDLDASTTVEQRRGANVVVPCYRRRQRRRRYDRRWRLCRRQAKYVRRAAVFYPQLASIVIPHCSVCGRESVSLQIKAYDRIHIRILCYVHALNKANYPTRPPHRLYYLCLTVYRDYYAQYSRS